MSLQRYVYIGIGLAILITFLVVGKALLVPFVFSILFALALSPVAGFFERKGINKFFASLITVLSVLTIVSVLVVIIAYMISDIYDELPDIQNKIQKGIERVITEITALTGISMDLVEENMLNNSSDIVSPAWSFVRDSITLSLVTLGNFFLILIYTFLLLYNRKGIKNVLLMSSKDEEGREQLMDDIRNSTRHYFTGIFTVMLILGVLNSTGLWIIGIDYAIFWGFLAAILVIIPYIGTTLGGIFPFLYALATVDTFWQPAAIVIMYYAIQQIEGNFITPKVVGSEINLNIMTILISMITGGLIWGISGIILAAPIAGILQVTFSRHEETKAVGLLMSNSLHKWTRESDD